MDVSARLSAASVNAASDVGVGAVKTLSALSRPGLVTVVDVSSGALKRVPWRAGLNLYGGSAMAKVKLAQRAVMIVRGGRLIYQTARALNATGAIRLQPGDVIRLAEYLAAGGEF